jgi:hypothetical protein
MHVEITLLVNEGVAPMNEHDVTPAGPLQLFSLGLVSKEHSVEALGLRDNLSCCWRSATQVLRCRSRLNLSIRRWSKRS